MEIKIPPDPGKKNRFRITMWNKTFVQPYKKRLKWRFLYESYYSEETSCRFT
jgi:hypothetical protein